MKKPKLIVITGPTASGKSALAVEVASRLDTGVISADSRQVYKGIPVVTAVPTQEERRGVAHHLLEVLPLDSYYSASEFERDALAVSEGLFERNGVAVVCGGSMMYVDALCNGIDELPTVPVMRGDEAAMEIRKIDRKDCREMPIIAMTANALESDVQNSYRCGMNGHISKPIEPEEVYKCLNKWLAGDQERTG